MPSIVWTAEVGQRFVSDRNAGYFPVVQFLD